MPARRATRWAACAVLAAANLLAGCASTPDATDAPARLRQLLDASDEAQLDRNPLYALYRGDLRRAARHGDYLSDAYVEAERRAAAAELAALARIPREQLPGGDRVAYDTFAWSRHDALERHSAPVSAYWPRLPLDQMNGWHVHFAVLSSGEGAAPYRTVKDYEDGLARLDGFVAYLDRAVGRLREGMGTGIVHPRVLVDRMIVQFERFAADTTEASPYYGPIRRLPAEIAPAERERLAKAYAAAIDTKLRPAFVRVRDFLARDYRPAARDSVGLSALPGGAAYYEALIRSHTTTRLSAEEVHRLGLAEVERITQGMQAVRQRVGYAGTLAQFFTHLRTDAAYQPASAQALADGYQAIGRRVDAALPRLFAVLPKTPLSIVPTPDFQAPTAAAANYQAGSPEIGKPGIFYFNTHDLPSRSVIGMETLYLHEGKPGHHMQIMLARENTALPKLLRYDGNTAFGEGWALYAESLGPALGLFEDPYQLMGRYGDEMLRAMRLVVDTALHAYGWSREQAIAYMLDHSSMSRTDVVAEVERYIADPGQALAYKVGELTIHRLRAKAGRTLGPRFDVRAFHDQVLATGSIPMDVLESKIDGWISAAPEPARR